MSVSSKIFEALTATIKLNDTIIHLTEDVKELSREVRDLDRRLIRLETFIEIAEKQRKVIDIHRKS